LGFSAGHWLHDISVCCIVAELTDEVGRTHQVPPDQLPFCECVDLRFDPSHDDVEVLGRCLDDRTRYRTRTYVSTVSYTHLRAHETRHDLVCRLLLEKKKKKK